MRLFSRAAGVSAALMAAVIGATFHAAPSRAWELDTAVVSLPTLPSQPAAAIEATVPAEPAAPIAEASLAAEPVEIAPAPAPNVAELECLAGAVYFEAKGEPLAGQHAVAHVILNRMHSGRFPGTACGVVKQRGQFSFVRAGRFPPIARASAAWQRAVSVARSALGGHGASPAGKALFFYARYVAPAWRGVTRVAAIGNHVFYR